MMRLLIIKTNQGNKIKTILDEKKIDYQVVADEIIKDQNLTEEEVWRRDILLANKDQVRNKEIAAWKKISKVKDKQGW